MFLVFQQCGISSWSIFRIYVQFVHTHCLITLPYTNSYTTDKKGAVSCERSVQIFVNSFVVKFLTRNAFRGTESTWHCQPLYTYMLFIYSLEEMNHTIRLSSVHLVKAVVIYQKITWRKLQYRAFSGWQSAVYCRLLKSSEFRWHFLPHKFSQISERGDLCCSVMSCSV